MSTITASAASELLDHAGAFYNWFATVNLNEDGTLTIEGDAEYIGDDDSLRAIATLTDDDLIQAANTLAANVFTDEDTYEGRFLNDFTSRSWENADGDTNIVDAILQQALWGDIIFG